jgi:hypothetical protein
MLNGDYLELLFSRLTWPSVFTRERACAEIAKLLNNPHHSKETSEFLVEWIKSQTTESECGLGLLALLRATDDAGRNSSLVELGIRLAIPFPSLQSALFLAELEGNAHTEIDMSRWHSGEPPAGFVPSEFFHNYRTSYVPPIYDYLAEFLEVEARIDFRRQWAYEWKMVLDRKPIKQTPNAVQFWISSRRREGALLAMDSPMSEVYRSAYLRALAWAADCGKVEIRVVRDLAAETIPIDLDLWTVISTSRPEWWPVVNEIGGEKDLDTSPAQIWPLVDDLWASQNAGNCRWGADWSLAFADGRVHFGKSVYDLSIHGFFHKRIRSDDPETNEVFEWLTNHRQTRVIPICHSPIRLGGRLRCVDTQQLTKRFRGWSAVPAVVRLDREGAISRWQWWRGFRGLHAPAPCLGENDFELVCTPSSIEFVEDGRVLGRWSDWTDGLTERMKEGLSPPTGQTLLVRRDVIQQFAEQHNAAFCWLVRMSVRYLKNSYDDEFQEMHQDRTYGTQTLIMPS